MPRRQPTPVLRAWPLIGRDLELEALSEALGDPACAGVGLIGAAGVGKTRLAAEVAKAVTELNEPPPGWMTIF